MAHSEAIFCVFFAYLSPLKVLRSWVNRFWKNLSVALWTAVLRKRKAER